MKTNAFVFVLVSAPKTDDFPKAPFEPTGTKEARNGLAPPTKPRAALKHINIHILQDRLNLAPPTKPRAALKLHLD